MESEDEYVDQSLLDDDEDTTDLDIPESELNKALFRQPRKNEPEEEEKIVFILIININVLLKNYFFKDEEEEKLYREENIKMRE